MLTIAIWYALMFLSGMMTLGFFALPHRPSRDDWKDMSVPRSMAWIVLLVCALLFVTFVKVLQVLVLFPTVKAGTKIHEWWVLH